MLTYIRRKFRWINSGRLRAVKPRLVEKPSLKIKIPTYIPEIHDDPCSPCCNRDGSIRRVKSSTFPMSIKAYTGVTYKDEPSPSPNFNRSQSSPVLHS